MPTGHGGCDAWLSSVPSAAGDAALLCWHWWRLIWGTCWDYQNTGWSLGNRLGLDKQKGSYASPCATCHLIALTLQTPSGTQPIATCNGDGPSWPCAQALGNWVRVIARQGLGQRGECGWGWAMRTGIRWDLRTRSVSGCVLMASPNSQLHNSC